eukprot:CAMPEP_0117793554 /NCGR_PEP_ID=MMETSP0948-20121206/10151_1 /TAXON_ID=44440 /ORGANISM="Chattonella subsalsa, Strain CCMP2191" /LENGTH=64 /DNA_ID=CAMNT_0005624079 /DNA_START=136 /DNA_END=326 /DNA_ORIENTATION=+
MYKTKGNQIYYTTIALYSDYNSTNAKRSLTASSPASPILLSHSSREVRFTKVEDAAIAFAPSDP